MVAIDLVMVRLLLGNSYFHFECSHSWGLFSGNFGCLGYGYVANNECFFMRFM